MTPAEKAAWLGFLRAGDEVIVRSSLRTYLAKVERVTDGNIQVEFAGRKHKFSKTNGVEIRRDGNSWRYHAVVLEAPTTELRDAALRQQFCGVIAELSRLYPPDAQKIPIDIIEEVLATLGRISPKIFKSRHGRL